MYLLHDSGKGQTGPYCTRSKPHQGTSILISRVETTISYPKGQMPFNARLSIISNTSSYEYRNGYIYLKEPSLQARSTPLQKTNCKSLSERPVLKSAMVPQFHARSEQLTVNADARNATAPRLPPMQGSQPLEISAKRALPITTANNRQSTQFNPKTRYVQAPTHSQSLFYKCFNPGSWIHEISITKQAELSRACPARRVLKTNFATLLTCERVCFRRPQNRHTMQRPWEIWNRLCESLS